MLLELEQRVFNVRLMYSSGILALDQYDVGQVVILCSNDKAFSRECSDNISTTETPSDLIVPAYLTLWREAKKRLILGPLGAGRSVASR